MVGIPFYLLGVAVWTLVEYLFHRYVLHGRFPPGEGSVRRFLHERLDPLHWEHHKHRQAGNGREHRVIEPLIHAPGLHLLRFE